MTKEKIKLPLHYKIIVIWAVVLFVGIICVNIQADIITFKFKSPSFSGVNTSSHYLTIENQEHMRKMTIKEEIKALQDELEREYCTNDVNIQDGTINYPKENGEVNKKD